MPPEFLTCGVQLQQLDRRGRNGEVNVASVCEDGSVSKRAKCGTVYKHVFALETLAGKELVEKQHNVQVDVRAAGLVGCCAAVVQGAVDDWTLDLSGGSKSQQSVIDMPALP